MTAKFDLNDDSVVVVIGSGAGGGTLGNELAQKGIKVVMLEAGGRHEIRQLPERRVGQRSSSSPGSTSAPPRAAGGWPGTSPTCRPGSARPWAAPPPTGPAPRCASRSTSSRRRTTYGEIDGRQPARLADHAGRAGALLRQGRGQDGRHPDQRHPRPARQQQFQGALQRVPSGSATRTSTPAAWRSTPAARRPRLLPADRLLLPGLQVGRQVVDALHRDPKGETSRQSRTAAERAGAADPARRRRARSPACSTPTRTASSSARRRASSASPATRIESPRLLLNSASAKFPDGLANSSGQVGRNYMRHMTGSVYAVFDKPVHMYRGTTMAGIIQDEAAHNPERGFVGGYEMETLSLGLPFMAAFLDPGAWGRDSPARWTPTPTWPACGWSARTCRRRATASPCTPPRRTSTACRSRTSISTTTPTTSPCADHAYRQGTAVYEAAGAARRSETPPYPWTHNLGTNRMSEKPRDGVVNKHGQSPRHQEPVRLRRQPVHHRRGREPDAHHRDAGDPPGRLHFIGDGQGEPVTPPAM